jgi:sarcosine oxidase subunit delta
MRFHCPNCGARDLREFTFGGADLPRPETVDWDQEWQDYLHLRDNPAGQNNELWYHAAGCGTWLKITRNTVTHDVLSVRLASDKGEGAA